MSPFAFQHDAQEKTAFAALAQGAVARAKEKALPGMPNDVELRFSEVLSCDRPQEVEPMYMLHAARKKLQSQSQMEH